MKTYQKITALIVITTILVSSLVAQELVVYVLPSPVDRTWESPREILLSTIKNVAYPEQYKKRFLGHVFIQLSNENEKHITGSSTAYGTNLKNMVLKEGLGLGVLNMNINGRLESKEDLSYELAQRFTHGNISFMKFKLSPEMYDRLKHYLVEYDKRDFDTIYNGQNKPREGKGAGCSAFAISFLEVAGFLKNDWAESWVKRVRVPLELVGNKIHGYKVGALKVIRSYSWASKEDPHVLTSFYDPNAMHQWIVEKCNQQEETEARSIRINNAIGLEYDYSNKDCPSDPIFFVSDSIVSSDQ